VDRYLIVMLGSALGGAARYAVSHAVASRFGGPFPLHTFVVNVTGSFLIGVVLTLLGARMGWRHDVQLFLAAGFLGGYTTFSSFTYESLTTMRQGHHVTALLYMLGSVVAGYAAVVMGAALAGKR
jgi:CrcB protein